MPPGRLAFSYRLLHTACYSASTQAVTRPSPSHERKSLLCSVARRGDVVVRTQKLHLILVHVPACLLAFRGLTRPTWTLCALSVPALTASTTSHFLLFPVLPPSIGSMFPSFSSSASASPPSHPDPDPLHPPSSPRPALLPLRYVMDLLDVDSAATHPHLSAHRLAHRA